MLLHLPHACWFLLLWPAITLPSPCATYLCHLLWFCLVPQCSSHIPCVGAGTPWSSPHQKHTHEHLPKQGIGEKIEILWTKFVPWGMRINTPNPTCLTSLHEIPDFKGCLQDQNLCSACFLVFHPHIFCEVPDTQFSKAHIDFLVNSLLT